SATLQPITVPNGSFPDSSAAAGISINPSISADGRYVAYESTAPNLVAGQEKAAIIENVYLFDRGDPATNTPASTTLVSHRVGSTIAGGDASSYTAIISGNGQFVYYLSRANNLVAGESGGTSPFSNQQLFV